MKKINFAKIRDLRKNAGLNQLDFWSRFGVTQSGGSRYETGRDMPTSVSMLIWLRENNIIDDKQLAAAKKAAGG